MTPLIDYANLDEASRTHLATIVAGQTSLQAVLDWGRTQRPRTPSGLKGGDKVLGYAACIFDAHGPDAAH